MSYSMSDILWRSSKALLRPVILIRDRYGIGIVLGTRNSGRINARIRVVREYQVGAD